MINFTKEVAFFFSKTKNQAKKNKKKNPKRKIHDIVADAVDSQDDHWPGQ